MPLSKPVREYLLRTGSGRLLLGNALALVRMGLIDADEAMTLFNLAHAQALATVGAAPLAERFQDSMKSIREAALVTLGAKAGMLPHFNKPYALWTLPLMRLVLPPLP